ncbi:bacteriophage antitermination protein Q, partial [Escherichia coli]|uniref:bacteriophage antitermination protein Q n=1 Tax=Escherichia coli TaxID=562 RepID=UPI0034D96F61
MSNEYLLEYTRIKLRAALRDLSGGSKGQLEALCEHPPADKNAYPRKHIHRVQLEDRTVDALVTAYSALFDHGLASKSDQRFASIRSTG